MRIELPGYVWMELHGVCATVDGELRHVNRFTLDIRDGRIVSVIELDDKVQPCE